MSKNYKDLWSQLISDLCIELVKCEKKSPQTVEDVWVKATLWQVLRKMCALDKLPVRLQEDIELTMPLFED